LFSDDLVEGTPLDKLHPNPDTAVVLIGSVNRDYVLVSDASQISPLFHQDLLALSTHGMARPEELERYIAI
jgi:hypothetical protein